MGRPRKYDEQSLLDAAQELFWTRGYDRTSLEDLASVSGVGTSSIYAHYGSKRALFLCVFGRYCASRVELTAEAATAPCPDLESAVAEYLDRVVADCLSHPDRRGCLMLNTVAELGDRFPDVLAIAGSTVERMETLVAGALERASAVAGRPLSPADARDRAETAVLSAQGLIQLSRVRVPAHRLRALAVQTRRSVAVPL